MLAREDTILVVVDIQGKLATLMQEKEKTYQNAKTLVEACQLLDIPILWCEQNPGGLGPTIDDIKNAMPEGLKPVPKFSFSCVGEPAFVKALKATSRQSVLICGIETHICVYQTASDLTDLGYQVEVVSDAVSSRTAQNREIGLLKIQNAGAEITSTECALFELLKIGKGDIFKQIAKMIK